MVVKLSKGIETGVGDFEGRQFSSKLSKKGGKDQESIQPSTTTDPGYHVGK